MTMKKATLGLIVFVSCFLGVLAALQIGRLISPPSTHVVRESPIYQVPLTQAGLYPGGEGGMLDFRAASKKVMPSVVTVDQFRQGVNFYGDPTGEMQTGTGSGVILSSDGIIVTNNHVVAGASRVTVRTSDHRTFTAKVLGTDPRSDIAVLKIDANNLTPIEIGDSDKLQVGEWVIAVGNPLGFENTVSVGVVSSLGRSIGVENSMLTDAIQTDAAINPGNSGGALTDANGRLIGINAVIASPTRASVGIGFAIPVNRVRKIVNDIRTIGYAQYAGLGVRYDMRLIGALEIASFREAYAREVGANPPSYGIIVSEVSADSAAGKAGVHQNDVLLEIDGKSLKNPMTLTEVLNRKNPGDKVSLKFWSQGQTKTAEATLQAIRLQD